MGWLYNQGHSADLRSDRSPEPTGSKSGSRGLNGAERNDTPGKRVNGVACRRYARRRRYPEKDPFCHPCRGVGLSHEQPGVSSLDADSTPGYRSLNPPDSGGSLTVNNKGNHHSSHDPRTMEETLVPAPPGQEFGLARLPAPAFPSASSALPGWRHGAKPVLPETRESPLVSMHDEIANVPGVRGLPPHHFDMK